MQIFTSIKDINISGNTAVALGNFDGIHIGHMEILNSAVVLAKEKGIKSLCYTFSNHPYNYIRHIDENAPDGIKLICTEAQKIEMLEELGFDYLVNVPFDEQTMKMDPNDFIQDILFSRLKAEDVCVGFNFTFGARASGNPELLKSAGDKAGVEIHVHDAVTCNGELISSTIIRKLIAEGDMSTANSFLGRDYCFAGKVQHGRRIGRTLGFPTVNLPAPNGRALPPNGVYFGHIELEGATYNCISNIGTRPTVEGEAAEDKSIETHIFDYEGDCYGKDIKVYFEHFARPEMKFSNREELHNQIMKDCEDARKYL